MWTDKHTDKVKMSRDDIKGLFNLADIICFQPHKIPLFKSFWNFFVFFDWHADRWTNRPKRVIVEDSPRSLKEEIICFLLTGVMSIWFLQKWYLEIRPAVNIQKKHFYLALCVSLLFPISVHILNSISHGSLRCDNFIGGWGGWP